MKKVLLVVMLALALAAAAAVAGCGSSEIKTAEDLEGTWSGSWNQFSTVDTGTPEVWADGSITFSVEGTYAAEFVPLDENEETFISEAGYTIEEDGDNTVIVIFGRGYYVAYEDDVLTLTAYDEAGEADISPTFELKQE